MVSMVTKIKNIIRAIRSFIKNYLGWYFLFELISLIVIAASFAHGFLPADKYPIPKFEGSPDPLSIIISLLPLVFTILSLMLGTPSDRIAGLERPTFLRLVPKWWPVGRRLLPFFIGYYVCLITVYSAAPYFPKCFNPFLYNVAASAIAIVFVGIVSFVNLSILLKTNRTVFWVLKTHVQEIVHEAEPLSSNLSDVESAVENMAETIGINATHKALLKKFRKVSRNPRVKPEATLLNSILQIEICAAMGCLEAVNLSSEARVEALAFAKAGIDNIGELLKDDGHFNLIDTLANGGDIPAFVEKMAVLTSLLHRLSSALKLQKESMELSTTLYLAGCNKLGKTYMDFDIVQLTVLAVELRLFVDGLYENDQFDNWLWKFLRDEIDYPLSCWNESPIYFFLAVYLFYAKDDQNLPQAARECISSFLDKEIPDTMGEKTNFIGRYATSFQLRPISQEKCLGLLKIIFGTFESLGSSVSFQYFPKNVSIVDDYPSLGLKTTLDCWMELFSSMKVVDKEKLFSGILEILKADQTGRRAASFMGALENSFDSKGKEVSERPFSKFVNGDIVPNYDDMATITDIVQRLFKEFGRDDSETLKKNPDRSVKSRPMGENSASASEVIDPGKIVEDAANSIVRQVRESFEPIFVEKGGVNIEEGTSKFLSFSNVMLRENFEEQFNDEYFYQPAKSDITANLCWMISQKLDHCFEGKSKNIGDIRSSLAELTDPHYSFSSCLGWRPEFKEAIKKAIPTIEEIADLDIFAPEKDLVERAALFNRGDIRISVWVDREKTIARQPSDDEVLTYLKFNYSMKNDRFNMSSFFDKKRYVWVTADDAVARYRSKLLTFRIVIGFAVSVKIDNCYFLEMPYTLN